VWAGLDFQVAAPVGGLRTPRQAESMVKALSGRYASGAAWCLRAFPEKKTGVRPLFRM
jgi:hypothetical protein